MISEQPSGKRVLTKKGSAFTLIRQEKALQELITKQTEVQEWIQSILNVRFESDNFVKNLEDGIYLCRLAEMIKKGSVKKVNSSKLRFKMMENITHFIQACKTIGVPSQYLFEPPDLCDHQNLMKVVTCIHKLADIAHEQFGFPPMERLFDSITEKNTKANKNLKALDENKPILKNSEKKVSMQIIEREEKEEPVPKTEEQELEEQKNNENQDKIDLREENVIKVEEETIMIEEQKSDLTEKTQSIQEEAEVKKDEHSIANETSNPKKKITKQNRSMFNQIELGLSFGDQKMSSSRLTQSDGAYKIDDSHSKFRPLSMRLSNNITPRGSSSSTHNNLTNSEKRRTWLQAKEQALTSFEGIERYYKTFQEAEAMNKLEVIEEKIKRNKETLFEALKSGSRMQFDEIQDEEKNTEIEEFEKRERQRIEILNEILISERYYIRDLEIIQYIFMEPIKKSFGTNHEILPQIEYEAIFCNIDLLMKVNQEIMYSLLQEYEEAGDIQLINIGTIFLRMAEFLKIYSLYSANYATAVQHCSLMRHSKKEFAHFLTQTESKPECRGINLMGYLIKPVQRICKYPLLFNELLKHTPQDHLDYHSIEQCFKKVAEVAEYVNEKKRNAEMRQKMLEIPDHLMEVPKNFTLLEPWRVYIKEFDLSKLNPHNKLQERHFFLFNDILIYAKARISKTTTYFYRGHFSLDSCLVNSIEHPNYPHSFEIVRIDAKKKKYTLVAHSESEKISVLEELSKLIDGFLKKQKKDGLTHSTLKREDEK